MSYFDHSAAVRSATYATSGALTDDVNCVVAGPKGENSPAGRVRIGTGGTLHVVYEDDTEDTITFSSGDIDEIRIKTIKADSTAQQITVYWFDRGK
jgi:hypothetical protein